MPGSRCAPCSSVLVGMRSLSRRCHQRPERDDGCVELPGVDTEGFTPREKQRILPLRLGVNVPLSDRGGAARSVRARGSAPARRAFPRRSPLPGRPRRDGARAGRGALQNGASTRPGRKDIMLGASPSRGAGGGTRDHRGVCRLRMPFCQHIAPELDLLWGEAQGQGPFRLQVHAADDAHAR